MRNADADRFGKKVLPIQSINNDSRGRNTHKETNPSECNANIMHLEYK